MNNQEKSTRPLFQQLLQKAMDFCVYQERSHHEVRNKLKKWNADEDITEEILAELIRENFLNEERFARQYALGKFHQNKWGKQKIKEGLKQHDISEYCIKKALENIDPEEYYQILTKLIKNKRDTLKGDSYFKKRQKLNNFALRKGFEYELINEVIKNEL